MSETQSDSLNVATKTNSTPTRNHIERKNFPTLFTVKTTHTKVRPVLT